MHGMSADVYMVLATSCSAKPFSCKDGWEALLTKQNQSSELSGIVMLLCPGTYRHAIFLQNIIKMLTARQPA
jgi:hypothetical protein